MDKISLKWKSPVMHHHQINYKAFATDPLRVCAANAAFIFCAWNFTCLDGNLYVMSWPWFPTHKWHPGIVHIATFVASPSTVTIYLLVHTLYSFFVVYIQIQAWLQNIHCWNIMWANFIFVSNLKSWDWSNKHY